MSTRILVPLDGSKRAEVALRYAELIPSRRVRLLAVEPVVLPPGLTTAAYLDNVAAPLRRQGRAVELVVESGDPGERIVAGAADSDLIVMATRGSGTVVRSLLGSVADHVARHAPVPTLLVRGTDPAVAPSVARIVVPLDGSERAEAALPVAARWGGDLGVRLHLVRVVDASTESATEGVGEGVAAYLDEQVIRLSAYDAVATSEVLTGPTARALLEAIGPSDLVVMTTRGRGGLRRALLGSIAEQLVREAAAPVLLVREGARGGALMQEGDAESTSLGQWVRSLPRRILAIGGPAQGTTSSPGLGHLMEESTAPTPAHVSMAPFNAEMAPEKGDSIDVASADSFPASDAPAWATGRGRWPVVASRVQGQGEIAPDGCEHPMPST